MTNQPIITILTDFGRRDGYVGAMQGVALSICPSATLVDLTHDIPPQDIQSAAFVLYQLFRYYPPHTVHCVVVDPGVGTPRREIALRTDRGVFVGPDNGVFSLVLRDSELLEVVNLTNRAYHLPRVSKTFHGRDIFMPAAAHIANGLPLGMLGPTITDLVPLAPAPPPGEGNCRIMHIDHFGNLILDITAAAIADPAQVSFTVGGQTIQSLAATFGEVAVGELVAYIGSTHQHIEIAIRNGNAAQRLGVKLGDVVKIDYFSEV